MTDGGAASPRANRLTWSLLLAGVVLLALVPNSLLVWAGVPYDIPGGSFLVKLHPATYVLALAYVSLALSGNLAQGFGEDLARAPATAFFMLTSLLMLIYQAARFGPSGSAFIIDTLMLPALLALLLAHFDDRERRKAFVLMVVLLAVNAVVGIGEAITTSRVIPYLVGNTLIVEPRFRATAFGGHPLDNALVTATYVFAGTVLLRRPRGRPAVLLMLLLYGLGLLAFGGRAAFVVAAVLGGLWFAVRLVRTSFEEGATPQRAIGMIIVLLVMPAIGIVLVSTLDLGGRIFAGFTFDASAQTRIGSFDAFAAVDPFDLAFGIGLEGVGNVIRLLNYVSGLTGTIENFWILWTLQFGVVGMVPLTATFLWFVLSLVRGSPAALWLAALAFLVVASGNNSLAAKDRALSFLVIALLGGAAAAREASQQPKAAETVDRAPRFQAGRATAASLACVVVLASLGSGAAQAQQQESPALARGVVLSHWLQYDGRQPVTSTDLAAIKAKGFDHVRIQFDPEQLGWSANLGDRMPARMERLDHAIDMVLSAGLTAVLDFHGEKPIQQAIEENEAARRAFVGFWHQAALRYRDRPETSVVFELLNEPAFYGLGGSTKWEALERRALAEIRAVDPERFVLFADNEADQTDPDDLEEPRDAVEDARVGYVFHLYSPHIFTHFGATWGEPAQSPYLLMERVVYPASGMAAVEFQAAPGGTHDRAVRLLREYAQQDWGPARVEALVARLAHWAESHHTRLFCTEFGVLRTRADPASRMAWLTDAREALERHRVPWTVFDYADIFGIATGIGNVVLYDDGAVVPGDPSDPKRRFDTAALAALGMSPPR